MLTKLRHLRRIEVTIPLLAQETPFVAFDGLRGEFHTNNGLNAVKQIISCYIDHNPNNSLGYVKVIFHHHMSQPENKAWVFTARRRHSGAGNSSTFPITALVIER